MTVFFTLLGSARTKAAPKTLMKLTPGMNSIKILQSAFLYKSFRHSYFVISVYILVYFVERKLAKMLMKSTCKIKNDYFRRKKSYNFFILP